MTWTSSPRKVALEQVRQKHIRAPIGRDRLESPMLLKLLVSETPLSILLSIHSVALDGQGPIHWTQPVP
jgi:hypothetical protein